MWAIITARKGSERLKDKNIRKFINKPLIEWAYVSTETEKFDKVILSTDCEECIKLAKNYRHIEVPFIRPEELSSSNSKSVDVIHHCLDYYRNLGEELPSYVSIIQPTTPETTKKDLEYLVDYVFKNQHLNGLSTFSVVEKPINKIYYHDSKIKKINIEKNPSNYLYENGMFYVFRTELLLKKEYTEDFIGSIPFKNIEPLIYPENNQIVDIDTLEDFNLAESKVIRKNSEKKKISLNINGRIIEEKSRPFVIAEVGINHEGSMEKTMKMIYDAYYSGCECIKFQCHIPEKEMTKEAKKVIPGNTDKSIYEVIERTSLTEEQEILIKKTVESLGMIYLCTPFSIEAADRLERMGVHAYKIGSGEMNNLQLIEHVAKFGKPMFISTGMNPLHKIRKTVQLLKKYNTPFSLFHCVSMYPTPYNRVNLPGIDDLQNEFPDILIGLSDHSIGITSCLGAYMKGCQIFEKHYTSFKNWPGPDIEISIVPEELKKLIRDLDILRECKEGKGRLEIQDEEQVTIDFAYCTLTTTKKIKKGHVFTKKDIIAKRPNIGDFLSEDIEFVLGKTLNQDLDEDEKIFKYMLS